MHATLFPVEVPDQAIEPPAAAPADPVFWVRRIALVEDRTPTTRVIREVSFRRGLNVIRVIDRPKDHIGSVGHSVGKTLLTRFIRYCLGERYYSAEEVSDKIVELFPSGHVIAEVVIGGVGWVVCRPFNVGGTLPSVAGQSTDWHDALNTEAFRDPLEQFLELLSQATIGQRPTLYLPDAKRNAGWLDLLGWLSRDQDCNFSHFNVWRSKDAHSGSREHSRNDASLIAAWGLSLIDIKEAEQREAHQKLLSQKEEAERVQRNETATQAASRQVLNERFPELSQEEDDSLFTTTAGKQVNEKVTQLKALMGDLEKPQDLMEMRRNVNDLRKRQTEASGKVERIKGAIQAKESQIQTEESANALSAYALTCFCPDKPTACPHSQPKKVSGAKEQSETVQRLQGEQKHLQEERNSAQAELDAATHDLTAAETVFDAAEEKHRDNLRKLSEQIGRWEAHVEEVEAYSRSRTRRLEAEKKLEKFERRIEQSEKALRRTREVQQQKLQQLSTVYAEVLTQLMGQDTKGALLLDGWGVHPQPATALRTNGLAMATLATVIGFDLASLQAAIAGLAPLPAFLIHDSPKASDLESALYDKIYDPVLQLDPPGSNDLPAFQYIVTSTTVPPIPASGDPYACLTLDARSPEGRLLGVEF
jgi:hypothetical protein